jgi:hypothetical protein
MSDIHCDPKTRQEKKNKRGSKEKQLYNQKHIRMKEILVSKNKNVTTSQKGSIKP